MPADTLAPKVTRASEAGMPTLPSRKTEQVFWLENTAQNFVTLINTDFGCRIQNTTHKRYFEKQIPFLQWNQCSLDMSTARRRLKSPQSLSGTSAHPTMVTLVNIMVMNGWLTSFSFHVNQPSHSWDKALSDSDLEISTPRSRSWVWSKGQDHTIGPVSYQLTSFSFHINQTNNSWDRAISKFDLEISKVKVISEVKAQGHILYPVSNRCTSFSFHINRTNHSWDVAKIVFDLEKSHPKFLKKICQSQSFQQNFSKINVNLELNIPKNCEIQILGNSKIQIL